MPLDGLTLHAIVNELGEKLKNGRIMKIYQPDRYTILLHLRLPGKNERLVISADPTPIHTTTSERENPLSPCLLHAAQEVLEPSRILGFRAWFGSGSHPSPRGNEPSGRSWELRLILGLWAGRATSSW